MYLLSFTDNREENEILSDTVVVEWIWEERFSGVLFPGGKSGKMTLQAHF